MKRTIIDRLVGFISPRAEFNRMRAKGQTEFLMRSYDAGKTFDTDDWTSATKGSANSEISGAQAVLRDKGRDIVRNNPYAGRGLTAIVSNTVGAGLIPNIKGKNSLQTRRLNEAWREWGNTTLCDAEGKHNHYGLQALVMRSTVESGEVLALKEINVVKDSAAHQLRIIESDQIASNQNSGLSKAIDRTVQGIRVDKYGRPVSYFLYESHPGDSSIFSTKVTEVSAARLCHIYRRDRPGQLRGVSWFHAVLRQLSDFNEYQQATLISKKVSACYAAFITSNNSNSTLSNTDLKTKRETEQMLSPGTTRYLDDGEEITFASPPAVDGYDEFCRQTLRAIASGLGITYEALTTDYSNVNFSSGRMGHIEFRRNVEMWRWGMLIPQFCEPSFQHFLEWCRIAKNIQTDGATCEWVPPAWSMIDPGKEIAAFVDSIRSGLTSYPKAVREQGYDPEELMAEIKDSNESLDKQGIILDSDPRKLTKAGILQVPPSTQSNSFGDKSSEEKDTDKKIPSDGESTNAD